MLQAALNIPYKNIIESDLSNYQGPIAENFIAQQLFAQLKEDLISWKPNNYQEVEFLYPIPNGGIPIGSILIGSSHSKSNHNSAMIPIEVKSSKHSSPSASLNQYNQKYNPPLAIKVAPRNYGKNGSIISLPIYLIEKVRTLVLHT